MNEDRRSKYYQDFLQLVNSKNGICLDNKETYETAHSKLKIKCINNHIWEISLNNFPIQ